VAGIGFYFRTVLTKDAHTKDICEVYCVFFQTKLSMLNSIQALRALAAWLVVAHHYMQVVYSFKLTDPISESLRVYGAIGVDLFFVISGFVIYLSSNGKPISPALFAAHRIARIVPAYWLFTLLTAATLIVLPGTVPLTQYDTTFLLKSLVFIPALNPSGIGAAPLLTVGWTLNYEVIFYGAFMLSLFLKSKYRLLALIASIICLCLIAPIIGGVFNFYANTIIYEFLFGVSIACIYKKGFLTGINCISAVTITLAAVIAIVIFGQVVHSPFKSGIPCAMIIIAAISQENHFRRTSILQKLGDWSYSTYLCHILVISYILKLQNHFNIDPLLTALLSVALIIAISAASYKLIEKPISTLAKSRPIGDSIDRTT